MRNIYLGDRGVLVQYLQLALTRAGYPVELDGIFGTDTCKALREFRREYAMHGETVGCYVDQSVWKQLIPYLKGYVTHVIEKRDTIWNIAGAYGTTQEAVLRANPSIQVNRTDEKIHDSSTHENTKNTSTTDQSLSQHSDNSIDHIMQLLQEYDTNTRSAT